VKLLLVDTSVWSLVLRRKGIPSMTKRQQAAVDLLEQGLLLGRVVTSETVVRELLDGVLSDELRKKIAAVMDQLASLPLRREHMERAKEIQRTCRSRGVQIGYADCEIIAVAEAAGALVLAVDRDFEHAQRVLGCDLLVILPNVDRK
jgi:predicted nucleic acid-binding protein